MIPTPEDLNPSSGGFAAWIGGGITAIIVAALGLRSWLSKDAAGRAGNEANTALINTLAEQLERANERADRFAKERNEAIEQIGELKAQIAALQATVNHMQIQIDKMVCMS